MVVPNGGNRNSIAETIVSASAETAVQSVGMALSGRWTLSGDKARGAGLLQRRRQTVMQGLDALASDHLG